jgi:hypothetical protein
MNIKTKCLIFIIIIGIIDMVIPVPILGIVLLYVVFQRPPWFADVVGEIYKTG